MKDEEKEPWPERAPQAPSRLGGIGRVKGHNMKRNYLTGKPRPVAEELHMCEFCEGIVEERIIQARFHFKGQTIYVDRVPAWVCGKCGEQYFNAPVYKRLEEIGKHRTQIKKTICFPLAEYDAVLAQALRDLRSFWLFVLRLCGLFHAIFGLPPCQKDSLKPWEILF